MADGGFVIPTARETQAACATPITASVKGLARKARRHFSGSDFDEVIAFELIRLAAVERDHDRARLGWQPHLKTIAASAEISRDVALESLLWDRQDLARYGRPLPRLWSCDPDAGQRYAALRPGPYRLDGHIRVKK